MKKNSFLLIIIFICLITFFYRLFFPIISIDTEVFINNSHELITTWYAINRFSLGIIKYIISGINFNIIFTNIISLSILIISLLIFSKDIFKKENDYLNRLLLILIIITSPLIAEQFTFTMQIFEISLGYLLLILNFKLINEYIYNNKKWQLPIIVLILAFVFGIYQAFCLLYITLSVIYFIVNINNKKNTLKEIIFIVLKYIVLFIIGILLCQLFATIMKSTLNISNSSYLLNQVGWSTYGLKGILYIGYYFLTVLFGTRIYYNLGYLIVIILTLIFIKKHWNKKNIILNISLLFLLITPFIMSIALGNETIARSQFALSFVISFVFIFYKPKNKYYYIIPLALIVFQIIITFILFRNDYIRYNLDLNLMNEIKTEISDHEDLPVVFIGEYNNNIKIKGDVLGSSFFNWDKETENGANIRIHGFFNANNNNYILPSRENIKTVNNNISKYNEKINIDNNIIVVNLYKY